MAIAYSKSLTGSLAAAGTMYNANVDAGSDTGDRYAVLVCGCTGSNFPIWDSAITATLGGQSFTFRSSGGTDDSPRTRIQCLTLANPPTGTVNLTISNSDASNGTGTWTLFIYTGVSQSSGFNTGTSTNQSSSSSSIALNFTTTSDNCWLVGGMYCSGGASPTGGTGTTVRHSDGGFAGFDSNGAKSPAGSHSISVNFGGSVGESCAAGVAIAPPAAGPANLKSYNTNLKANIKTINTNAIANVKSLNTNT